MRGVRGRAMLKRCQLAVLACLLAAVACAHPATAQKRRPTPVTLESIVNGLREHMGSTRLLEIATERCIAFALDDSAARQIVAAGGSAELVQGLRRVCRVAPAQPARPVVDRDPITGEENLMFEPGAVAFLSAVLPGWGQVGMERDGTGALFMGGAAASIVAFFYKPSDAGVDGRDRHPYRTHGIVAYTALSVTSAIDGYIGARRRNARVEARRRARGTSLQLPTIVPAVGGTELQVVRLTF